jgi:hypothetical protein
MLGAWCLGGVNESAPFRRTLRPVSVDLDERIKSLVETHRPELLELVDRALEQALAQLVEERIAIRNGSGAQPALLRAGESSRRREHSAIESSRRREDSAVKVCKLCGKSEPEVRFDPYRRQCRGCRSARARERQAPPADTGDGPRPAGNAQPG